MSRSNVSCAEKPLILFGAFDRHNFGDVLLGAVARAVVAPRPVVFAGLAERDLSACGGEKVRAVTALADEWDEQPAELVHVGGELLTCTLYEAAVMLLPDAEARRVIARFDADAAGARVWAAGILGLDQPIAYQVSPRLFRHPGFFAYLGVGGMALDGLPEEARQQVMLSLKAADFVWVRDRETHRQLRVARVSAVLAPDPAELVAVLFGRKVDEQAQTAALRSLRERYPSGYLAVQFSADFGDDATLERIAGELRRIQQDQRLGIVIFRAGNAPWHDRLDVYQRLLQRLPELQASLFTSLNIWDICALLARSRGFIGTSLHGRIVAEAFGLPAVSLVSCPDERSKAGVYVASWRAQAGATVASAAGLHGAFRAALEAPVPISARQAMVAVDDFRRRRGLSPLFSPTSMKT